MTKRTLKINLPMYMTSLSQSLQKVENKFIISGSDNPQKSDKIKTLSIGE